MNFNIVRTIIMNIVCTIILSIHMTSKLSIKDYQSKYDKSRSRPAVSLHPVSDADIIKHIENKVFSSYVKSLIRYDIAGKDPKTVDWVSNDEVKKDIVDTIRKRLHLWNDEMQGSALIGLKFDIVKRLRLDKDFIDSLDDKFLYSLMDNKL